MRSITLLQASLLAAALGAHAVDVSLGSSALPAAQDDSSTDPGAADSYERPLWAEIVSAVIIIGAGVGVAYVESKTVKVITAVLTGVVTGLLCTGLTRAEVAEDAFAQLLFLPGSLWLRSLKCLVLPLIIFAMVESMVMLRNLPGARSVGGWVIGMYTMTTVLAATEGCIFAYAILTSTVNGAPADGPTAEPPTLADRSVLQTVTGLIINFVPSNLIKDMSTNNFLPLICFSLAFGYFVRDKNEHNPSEPSTVMQGIRDTNAVVIKLIEKIMDLTAYGVGSLVFQALVLNDITKAADELFYLCLTVILGLAFHALVVYPTILSLAGYNPIKYIMNIDQAIMVALGTSSSATTLSVSLHCAKEKNGIVAHIADFVLTLGATINMDGTGLYLICATYFLARMQEATFGLDKFLLLGVLATLTSAGSAPVPSASLVLLATIIEATGLEYNEGHFGLILMIDWLLDRMRTMVNVIGDATVTAVIQSKFGVAEGAQEVELGTEGLQEFAEVMSTKSKEKIQMYASKEVVAGDGGEHA